MTEENRIHIELSQPPPSTNRLARKGRNGFHKSDKYQAWLRDMGWEIKAQGPFKTICEPFAVSFRVRRTRKDRDLDNCLKAPLDLLQGMKVIEDDKLMMKLDAEWADVPGIAITLQQWGVRCK